MDSVALTVILDGEECSGFEVTLECGRRRLPVGAVEPSGDPLLPWRTGRGQLAASPAAAALLLAAAWLEDERMDLLGRLACGQERP